MSSPEADPIARAAATTKRFREAVESRDVDGFLATLAPGARLRSPITMLTEFDEVERLRELMVAVFESIEDIRYFEDVGDESVRALFYRAHVGGQHVEEATLLRLDDQGRVREITLFFRPLPGLTAVAAALGPRLARRRGVANWLVTSAMLRPLAAITRAGDRLGVRLVSGARSR